MEAASVFSEYFLAHLPVQFTEPLIEMPFDCPTISESMRSFPAEFETKLGEPELGQPCQPTMEVFSDDEPEFGGFHSDSEVDEIEYYPNESSNEHSAANLASNQDHEGWYVSIQKLVSRLFHGIKDTQPGSAVTSQEGVMT